jgi:hypothetical protein
MGLTSGPDPRGRSAKVALANEVIPFATACRLAGVDVPPPSAKGSRAHCPFEEFSHPDEGRDPAMRVYFDHGYCFAEALYFSPVRIYAMVLDVDEETAATQLLDRAGVKPASYEQRWTELTTEKTLPDLASLSAALRTWLTSVYPDWNNQQYDPAVAHSLASCLGLLAKVRETEDCRTWLAGSKQVMARALGGAP